MRALAIAVVGSLFIVLGAVAAGADDRADRLEQDVRKIQAELCVMRLVDDTTPPSTADTVRLMCEHR